MYVASADSVVEIRQDVSVPGRMSAFVALVWYCDCSVNSDPSRGSSLQYCIVLSLVRSNGKTSVYCRVNLFWPRLASYGHVIFSTSGSSAAFVWSPPQTLTNGVPAGV